MSLLWGPLKKWWLGLVELRRRLEEEVTTSRPNHFFSPVPCWSAFINRCCFHLFTVLFTDTNYNFSLTYYLNSITFLYRIFGSFSIFYFPLLYYHFRMLDSPHHSCLQMSIIDLSNLAGGFSFVRMGSTFRQLSVYLWKLCRTAVGVGWDHPRMLSSPLSYFPLLF